MWRNTKFENMLIHMSTGIRTFKLFTCKYPYETCKKQDKWDEVNTWVL